MSKLVYNLYNLYALYIAVSLHRGTPKSSILMGFSLINHPFGVPPFSGNLQYIHISCDSLIAFTIVWTNIYNMSWHYNEKIRHVIGIHYDTSWSMLDRSEVYCSFITHITGMYVGCICSWIGCAECAGCAGCAGCAIPTSGAKGWNQKTTIWWFLKSWVIPKSRLPKNPLV